MERLAPADLTPRRLRPRGQVPTEKGREALDRLRKLGSEPCKKSRVDGIGSPDLRILREQAVPQAMLEARGQRKLSVTADTYTHVLSDGRELDDETLEPDLVRP